MITPTWNLELKTLNWRRPPRRGVTIIEVLFAIMVATVGVFSVIAIFPFASSQAKRARLNDMFAVAGRSAFHDFDARGMRIPDHLMGWDQGTGGYQSLNELTQLNQPDFSWATVTPFNFQKNEAFCIDPRFVAANTIPGFGLPAWCRTFPYQEPFADSNGDGFWQSGESFTDLNNNGVHEPFQYSGTNAGNTAFLPSIPTSRQFDMSLMRRVTLWDGIDPARYPGLRPAGLKFAMSLPEANTIFTIEDDIAYTRDEHDKSKPPTQDLIPLTPTLSLPTTEYLKRDSERKISWIATLVPQLNLTLQSDEYTLSVVMIYERTNVGTPGIAPTVGGLAVDKFNERVVTGYPLGGGVTGGEFVFISSDPEQLKLRPNSWVMVSGVLPSPNLNVGRFQWYRITECDPEPSQSTLSPGNYELYATLMGQDWNMSVSAPTPPPYMVQSLINRGVAPVRVTIVQGAFAVYEKTIRMEGDSSY